MANFIAPFVNATHSMTFNGVEFESDANDVVHAYWDAGHLQAKYNLLDGSVKTAEGIYFGKNNEANKSAIIEGVEDIHIAELVASNNLLSIADGYGITKFKIHADSGNLIDAVNKMDRDFFEFQRKNKKYQQNPEQYDNLFVKVIAPARHVNYVKVKSHDSLLTPEGNKQADKLATAALKPFKVPANIHQHQSHLPVHLLFSLSPSIIIKSIITAATEEKTKDSIGNYKY